jgi:SNF2 family DNA or RNA helicase
MPPIKIQLKTGIRPLMEHQKKSLQFKLANAVGADFSEVGTGKSATMAIALDARRQLGDSQRILWVTTKTMMGESAKEIAYWTNFTPTVLLGDTKQKVTTLKNLSKQFFIITNYDSLPLLEKELTKLKVDSVVCDESSAIKNWKSLRSKALCKIAKTAKFRWIMTGTPMPNTVLDIFGQWKFVEPTLFSSVTEFKREYCLYAPNSLWPILIGYKNLDELKAVLFERAVRFLRDECFQLPDRTFIKREVQLGASQKKAYKDLRKDYLCALDSGQTITANGILDQLIKLSEVTSGFIKDAEGNLVELSENAKLTELKTLLEECDLPNTKAIIWCVFTHTIKTLQEELKDYGPAILYGAVKAEDRTKELERLRTDPRCRILIAQVATGEGFTINEAPISIYFENDFSWKNRDQSLGRNYRLGQKQKVVVYDLVCPGTIDEAKLKALDAKKSIQDVITGDNLRGVVDGQV